MSPLTGAFLCMKQTIEKISGAIMEETVTLQVDIRPRSWIHKLLIWWKWMPAVKKLVIEPITFGSVIKISGILAKMNIDFLKDENLLNEYYKAVDREGRNIAKVIAIAVVNGEKDPPDHLVRFILRNFRPRDLLNTFSIVHRQMDVTNFIHSMVLMGKMNLHEKTSPKDQGSSIASGEQSALSSNTSGSPGST